MNTSIVVVNLVVAYLLNVVANIFISKRGQGETGRNYDIIQSNTTDLSDYRKMSDYMMYFIVAVALYNYKHLPIHKILKILTIFMVLRSISIFATSLHDCPKKTENKCQYSIKRSFQSGGCEDKMFSGHTLVTLTLCYYLSKAFNGAVWNALFGAYATILSVLAIVVRAHYTIDVIAAWALFCFLHF